MKSWKEDSAYLAKLGEALSAAHKLKKADPAMAEANGQPAVDRLAVWMVENPEAISPQAREMLQKIMERRPRQYPGVKKAKPRKNPGGMTPAQVRKWFDDNGFQSIAEFVDVGDWKDASLYPYIHDDIDAAAYHDDEGDEPKTKKVIREAHAKLDQLQKLIPRK